jgi:ABC-2 type transport system permease protein
MHGTVTAGQITWVVLISAGILAVFGPLTMYLYGNKNNH